MTPPTTDGRCPVCGHGFTTSAHQRPRRRYCSERCRKTAWRHRHPEHRSRPRDVPHTVPRPGDVSPTVPDATLTRAEPATRCPHCARPIAVITLLVNPAAATVPAPGARHGH
jgi:hypothetical protein